MYVVTHKCLNKMGGNHFDIHVRFTLTTAVASAPAPQVRMWMPSSRSNDALDDIHNGAQASDTDTRLLPRTLFSSACLAIYVNKCWFFSPARV